MFSSALIAFLESELMKTDGWLGVCWASWFGSEVVLWIMGGLHLVGLHLLKPVRALPFLDLNNDVS